MSDDVWCMLCMQQMIFLSPVMVASSVENLWLYARKSHVKPHLTEALWLGCGSAGMKVCLIVHAVVTHLYVVAFLTFTFASRYCCKDKSGGVI